MESHEVERQFFKLVSPVVILVQVLLQPLHSKLSEHDLGQADIVNLKASPQRVDTLHTQIQSKLADKGGLSTTGGP